MAALEDKIEAQKGKVQQSKLQYEAEQKRLHVLKAFLALQTTGLKFGDRFRINGEAFKQKNPEGVITGHEDGVLVGKMFNTDGRLSGNLWKLHTYRLNDVTGLGPDPTFGSQYAKEFDASQLGDEDNL